MTKTWIADIDSFKKHPQGEISHRVIVKAKFKKDAIEEAKKELKFWDPENHLDYKMPAVVEIDDEEEAQERLTDYLCAKEVAGQNEITEQNQEEAELNAESTVRTILANIGEESFSDEMIEEAAGKLENVLAEHENLDVQATLQNLAQHTWKVTFPMDTESEVCKMLLNIRRLRNEVVSLLLHHGEKATSFEVEKTEMASDGETFEKSTSQLTAKIATVAEYPITEPYSIRVAVAKNDEKFIQSMCVMNCKTGGRMYGQLDVFNPKPFSNIENAVIYGLSMAIDAVNAHLVDFLNKSQLETSAKILWNYAKDAEGNFIERCIINDYDLSNATLMAVSKPKVSEIPKDVERIVNAVKERVNIEVLNVWEIQENFIELHDEHGTLPAAQIVEHVLSMTCASELVSFEACEELVGRYLETKPADESQEEPPVKYYAGQCWIGYVKEIMAQFEPPFLDDAEIDAAAQNVANVFNDWKVGLFAEKDNYTANADIFKDEVYLNFDSSDMKGALDMLKSYARTQDALCNVLASAYDEFIERLPNPKVSLEINNLVSRLLVDETLGCTYSSETVKALMYSELTANPVEDSTITNPMLKMQWWSNLRADFAKQQAARFEQKQDVTASEELEQNTDAVQDAFNERVAEIKEQAKAFEQEACVHGDGVTETLPENIEDAEIIQDTPPAQEFYGDKLLSGEIDAPYQYAVALMLKDQGAENYFGSYEYEQASSCLQTATGTLKESFSMLKPGATVESMVENHAFDSYEQAKETLLDTEELYTLLYQYAEFEEQTPAEPQHDEQEAARQDDQPVIDEPVTTDDCDSANGDAPKELTVRDLFKLQMRTANKELGAMGLAWGYEIKRQWKDESDYKRIDCHCEVAIWYRDKNGTKTEPMSFFGTTGTKVPGDYVNDAMTMALVNGLDAILFSLGIEVEV